MKKIIPLLYFLLVLAHNLTAQITAGTTANAASCSLNNGSATVYPSGGNSYTYSWSNGATTATATGLAPGTYTVTVYGTIGGGPILNTLYSENFDGANTWTLNTSTGSNGSQHNYWTINDTAGGAPAGVCSQFLNGDKSLHIRAKNFPPFIPYTGALYEADFGGFTTNLAATSPAISTIGATSLTLSYNFIGNGEGNTDFGSSYYSTDGGTTYHVLDPNLKSQPGCGTEGKWDYRSYHLPASCNNISNLVLKFNWTNDANGFGTDPSVAINNIVLGDSIGTNGTSIDSVVKTVTIGTNNVHAYFVVTPWYITGIYVGENQSTGIGLHYHWEFGDNSSYDGAYPIYTYAVPGYYNVCLTATDVNGCSDTYCDSSFYTYKTNGGPMSQLNIHDPNATGIQDINYNVSLNVSPNPSTGELNISSEDFRPEQICIYDVNGRKVMDQKYQPQLNVTGLESGIYFIEVKGSNALARKIFMKQ